MSEKQILSYCWTQRCPGVVSRSAFIIYKVRFPHSTLHPLRRLHIRTGSKGVLQQHLRDLRSTGSTSNQGIGGEESAAAPLDALRVSIPR